MKTFSESTKATDEAQRAGGSHKSESPSELDILGRASEFTQDIEIDGRVAELILPGRVSDTIWRGVVGRRYVYFYLKTVHTLIDSFSRKTDHRKITSRNYYQSYG